MVFNTTLLRFGFDSSNFVNKPVNVIETNNGLIYEVEEDYKKQICPNCNYQYMFVHGYKWISQESKWEKVF